LSNPILFSAPAARNRQHILEVLRAELPDQGSVLEIASGTGQHIAYFAQALPALHWQPSDPDPDARASISARVAADNLSNVSEPLSVNVLEPWPAIRIDAVITANLLHISAPEVLPALMEKAGSLLAAGCLLHIYGPFRVAGTFTSPSNAEFDASLRRRNPFWGIRDLEAVIAEAHTGGFGDPTIRDMPANNLSLTFRRR
jgi:SAM-dependent methyltransferase